jgi:hypothetical protein
MFCTFKNFASPSSPKTKKGQKEIKDARRDASKNIDGEPILRVHDHKKGEPMHEVTAEAFASKRRVRRLLSAFCPC